MNITEFSILKCTKKESTRLEYEGSHKLTRDKYIINSYPYSKEKIEELSFLCNFTNNFKEFFIENHASCHRNNRSFLVSQFYDIDMDDDFEGRIKSKEIFTEQELKILICHLIYTQKAILKMNISLNFEFLSLTNIKIFENFQPKIAIWSKKELLCSEFSLEKVISDFRLLVLKLIFLGSKKKFSKLKTQFQSSRIDLEKKYSTGFVFEINHLIFDADFSFENFKFKESPTNPLSNFWNSKGSSCKYKSLTTSSDFMLSKINNMLITKQIFQKFYFKTKFETFDANESYFSPRKYDLCRNAKWLNQIETFISGTLFNKYALGKLISMKNFANLQTLDLSKYRVTDFIIRKISTTSYLINLDSLILRSDHLTPNALFYLSNARNLHKLSNISLEKAGFGGDKGIKKFVSADLIRNLSILNFFDNYLITDLSIEYLSRWVQTKNLVELSFEGCNIEDFGVEILSKNECFSGIKILNLSRTNVTEVGIHHYSQSKVLTKIEILYLNECKINDIGVEYLASSANTKSIQYLYLVDCGLTSNVISILKNHEAFKNLKGHKWGPYVSSLPKEKKYQAM